MIQHVLAILAALSLALASNARAAGPCPHEPSPAPVEEVAPGVFVRVGIVAIANPRNRNAIANLGFIIGRDSVAVIDTGGSACDGASVRAAIREQTQLPIRYVFNTHAHPDHALGAAAFVNDKPEFVAHRRFPAALAARGPYYLEVYRKIIGDEEFAGTTLVPSTKTVETTFTADLGDRVLEATAFPPAHTDNDLTVLDKKTGTLFAGDLVFLEHIPVVDGDLNGWLSAIDKLAGMTDVKRVVPGHGPASAPWPRALDAEKNYLTRLSADVHKLVNAGADIREAKSAAAKEAADWKLSDEFHERNANTAFSEEEWR